MLPAQGRSLRPYFSESPSLPLAWSERALFWEHEGNKAVRQSHWKAVAQGRGAWELYDLKNDRTETRDLATEHAEKARDLAALWQVWAGRCGVWEWDDLQQHRRDRKQTGKAK